MIKKTPREWIENLKNKNQVCLLLVWKLDARRKENKKSLKSKISFREFTNKYVY